MSANEAGLSPAGTSSYDSSTLHVGDGTWDASRDSFLLPNLQGLNFATMQYNGMGNRFRGLPEYHVLVTGHGVVAAITFLGILPAAIFIARFLHSEGRLAYKLHVYLQILVVLLATVVIILGTFAVGPERALTNPHHGIGVAIYVCVLVQFLFGWWMSRRERKRQTPHPTIPVKVHLHRLFGRAIALLAFVQVALGLTLYGSPKVLFILYALWGAFLLFWYLTLEYRNKARLVPGAGMAPGSDYYSDYSGSYLSGSRTQVTQDRRRRDRSSGHWGEKLLAGAGLVGAYEWYKHKRDRRLDEKEERYEERMRRQHPPSTPGPASSVGPPPVPYGPGYGPSYGPPGPPGSVPPPAAYNSGPQSGGSHHARRQDDTVMSPQSWEQESEDEKYTGRPPRRSNTWRDRILGAGAGIAAFEGVKSLFGSKKRRNDGYVDSDVSYRPPPGASEMTQTDVSRVEAGQAPFSPQTDPRNRRRVHMADDPTMTPTRPPGRRRPSVSSLSYDDEGSSAPSARPGAQDHTLRDSIATLGAVAGFREWNRRRKQRREAERADRIKQQELENEEQFTRRNSDRYPRPQDASGRRPSVSDTLMTGPSGVDPARGSNPELSRQQFRPDTSHPPLPAAAGTISASGYGQQDGTAQQFSQQQTQNTTFNIPPPPPGPPPHRDRPADYHSQDFNTLSMPQGAINPDPSRLVSEQYQTQTSNGRYQDGTAAAATEAAAAAAGVAASQRTQSQSPSRRTGSRTRFSRERRSSSAGPSNSNSNGVGPTGSPPVSVKVNMHPDGRHVTLRRLNEEEAAAERSARRRERRSRRPSSLSSGGEDASGSRFRRNVPVRDSSQQPITNVPVPPPAMSNSALGSNRRNSELNLPPVPSPAGRVPRASESATPPGLLPAMGPAGSGTIGSPGAAGTDLGTGTDVSAFDSNRRRRRAERARRAEAAKGGNKVEFE